MNCEVDCAVVDVDVVVTPPSGFSERWRRNGDAGAPSTLPPLSLPTLTLPPPMPMCRPLKPRALTLSLPSL